jgi:uncharacterized repeat protein (TIGR01451 family)
MFHAKAKHRHRSDSTSLRARARQQRSREYRLRLESLEPRQLLTGTWQTLAPTNPSAGPTGEQAMNLLSDGTVIVQSGQGSASAIWYKLSPSASGSYVNGTWSPLAPMNLARRDFNSAILPDGRVIVVGAEYYGPSNTLFTNTCEMYDPVHNTWTYIASAPSPTGTLGECPIEVLPDGRVLASDKRGPTTSIYSPSTNTWTAAPDKLRADWTDEETWVKLPDNSILSYDIWSSISDNTFHAQRYIPDPSGGVGQWVDASNVDSTNPPALLSSPSADWEIGPGFLQADGRVIQFGALGNTAIYNPATDQWSAGPAEPTRLINGVLQQLTINDAAGATLPNGNIVIKFTPMDTSISGTFVYEYDPVAQTFTDVTPSGGIKAGNMLILPTGQVLASNWDAMHMNVYTPSGAAPAASQPTISGVADNHDGTFTLTGTQLNGISEGADFGDDAGVATNYPIVQLSSTDGSGHVYFAKTFNWSSTGVATGSTPDTTNFSLPASLPYGTYSLCVIANGIASNPVTFTGGLVGPSADLAVTNNGPTTSTEGSNVTYSLTVTNNGPSSATNVVLTDTLGANLKYVSATKSQGSVTQTGSNVTYSFGTVAVGQTVTGTVTVQTLEDGNLTNFASVTSSLSDANQNNNTASATTAVAEPAIVVSGPISVNGKKQNNVTVATFTHANGVEPASAFVATINWGDGSTSPGTVAKSGTSYSVTGSHTYSGNGSHTVTTTVIEPIGSGGNPKPGPGKGRDATSGKDSPATPIVTTGADGSSETSSNVSDAKSARDAILASAPGFGASIEPSSSRVNVAGAEPIVDADSLDALFGSLGSSDVDSLLVRRQSL